MRIIYITDYDAVLLFSSRPPLKLRCDSGHIRDFVAWFLGHSTLTWQEYRSATISQQEPTCPNITLHAA